MARLKIKNKMSKSAKLIRRKNAIDEQIKQILEELKDENKVLKNKSNKYEEQEE